MNEPEEPVQRVTQYVHDPNLKWCAMCGKMTNHQSGSCPDLRHTLPNVIPLILNSGTIYTPGEPRPDIAVCSQCNTRTPTKDCPTKTEGDRESGYYAVHVCPKCKDGGLVDAYAMTPEQARKWHDWRGEQLLPNATN